MNTLQSLLILSSGFLFLFALAELLKVYCKIKGELTRKLVHIGTGLLSLTFPVIFNSHWTVLFLCASFFGILFYSKKNNLLSAINGINRKSHGSLLFPVSVYLCFLMQQLNADLMVYTLPLLILSFSDPLAALVGQRFPYGKYEIMGHTKTWIGSLSFCLSAFCISWTMGVGVQAAILIATISGITEAVSKNGFDNLTIPSSVILALQILEKPIIC